MAQSFKVSEIEIGMVGNKITANDDGSMVFRDRFVPGVRLVDLLAGSTNSDSLLSIKLAIPSSAWTVNAIVNNVQMYKVIAYFGYLGGTVYASFNTLPDAPWSLLDATQVLVVPTVTVGGKERQIGLQNIDTGTTSIDLYSSQQINLNIRIKKI